MDERVKAYFKLDRAASVWWFPEEEPLYRRQLEDLFAVIDPRDKLVIDVGTGRGRFAIAAARAGARHVLAFDISRRMLEIARANAERAGCAERISFARADAECLPLRDAAADLVNCLEVFVHLPHPRQAWLEMARVARPGADLIANTDYPVSNAPLFLLLYGFHTLRHHPRKVLALLRARLGIGRPEHRLHKRDTIDETIAAVERHPETTFTRPEDALARLPREDFLRLLGNPAIEIRAEIPCGFRWLPHGLVAVARKRAGGPPATTGG
jgi:SAM-dependent methyltransferase